MNRVEVEEQKAVKIWSSDLFVGTFFLDSVTEKEEEKEIKVYKGKGRWASESKRGIEGCMKCDSDLI